MPAPLGVAVVGCGTISDEYLRNLTAFPDLQVVFCADLDLERAKGQAAAYGVPAAGTLAQALEHDGVQLVVNLTLPGSHVEVAAAAIAAGKHVWNEKPLAVLELMVAVETSLSGTAFEPVDSGFVVPPPLPEEWDPYARTV